MENDRQFCYCWHRPTRRARSTDLTCKCANTTPQSCCRVANQTLHPPNLHPPYNLTVLQQRVCYKELLVGYAVLPGVDFRRHALSALWISPESPSVTPYGNKAKFTKLSWRYMQRMPVSFKGKPARNPSADASHRGNRKCALQA